MSAASGARWRPEVEWFADAMERKLRANDYKRHWLTLGMQTLSMRLTQERKELHGAIAEGDASKVLDECADIANFAMMIADKARAAMHITADAAPKAEQVRDADGVQRDGGTSQ